MNLIVKFCRDNPWLATTIAFLVVALLGAAAFGAVSDDTSSSVASGEFYSETDDYYADATDEPVPDETSTPVKTTEPPAPAVRQASCSLAGSHPGHVTVVADGDTLTATFTGTPISPSETTGLYVTVFDATGNNGGQMGAKFLDGEQIAYFSADGNISRRADVSGSTVVLAFPLGGVDIAKWSAAYTLAGADVGNCPGLGSYNAWPGTH